MTTAACDWLLTAAIHAVVLAVLAALLGRRSLATREWLLRAALFASPLTAALQVAGGVHSWCGGLLLGAAHGSLAADSLGPGLATALPSALPLAAGPAAGAAVAGGERWALACAIAYAVLVVGGLLQLLWATVAGRRCLQGRQPLPPAMHHRAAAIARRLRTRPPRLSCVDSLAVPVAFGLRHPEVCLPPRALRDLEPSEFDAALAHEIAHLRRLDALWAFAAEITCRLLPVLPSHWLLRGQLARLAELRADDLAARASGAHGRMAMARALVRAAAWLRDGGRRLSPAMARSPSELRRRVERLLQAHAAGGGALRARTRLLLVTVMASSAWWLPALRAEPPQPRLLAMAVPVAAELPTGLEDTFPELAAAAGELALLRQETESLRLLVAEVAIDDPLVEQLLQSIAERLGDLEQRCRALIEAARAEQPSAPQPHRPSGNPNETTR